MLMHLNGLLIRKIIRDEIEWTSHPVKLPFRVSMKGKIEEFHCRTEMYLSAINRSDGKKFQLATLYLRREKVARSVAKDYEKKWSRQWKNETNLN